MSYYWNGIKIHSDPKVFKKFHYSAWPLYRDTFLQSWKRKRKWRRLRREERETCEKFLKRLKREGDRFAARRFFIQKIDPKVGFGLFARKKIRKGAVIGVYSGKTVEADEKNQSRYLFFFSKMKDWDIDASRTRNYTAFMNHAKERTVACNVKSVEFYCEEPKILFLATREIEKGSQLCYDYGDDYWGPLEEPDDFKRVSKKKGFSKNLRAKRG